MKKNILKRKSFSKILIRLVIVNDKLSYGVPLIRNVYLLRNHIFVNDAQNSE